MPISAYVKQPASGKNATANETDRLVISAVSGIANGPGRQTVAEVVPDDPTIALLLRHGVDLGQGYHLGRPAPLADLLAQAPDCLRA